MRRFFLSVAILILSFPVMAADPWLTIPAGDGSGKGKHVVLISGDEEYRSEECLPQLAKILAKHHGFKCTVLFAIDPKDGTINPQVTNNIPGLEALKTADLCVMFIRMRNLPADQMAHFAAYLKTGKPIIGLRTATHAFQLAKDSPYFVDYQWNNPDGGFGRKVLGETWVAHHGNHGKEGTRGRIAKGQESHPILSGIKDGELFGPTDVYTVKLPLPGDSQPLILGEVTKTLDPNSEAVAGKKNDPMMPICWTKTYEADGRKGRTFTSTLASGQDFANEGLRRVFVNACYWCLGMESSITTCRQVIHYRTGLFRRKQVDFIETIPVKANVDLVGTYEPLPFKAGGHKKGVTPENLK